MCHPSITAASRAAFVLSIALMAAPEASAQEAAPPQTAAPTAGLPTATEAEQESGGWLMSSPLVDVGWPKISMPKVNWKPFGGAEADGPPKPGPLTRMTQATQGAFQRGRTAWNNTIDKMKVGPFRSSKPAEAGEEPSFFAKMFGGGEEPQRAETVAEFIGQDRPTMR